MYTQPKTSISSCFLALLTLALPIHGAALKDDAYYHTNMMGHGLSVQNNDDRLTEEQKTAFESLVYRKNGVSTFLVAKHFGDRHYWKFTNGSDMALGTTKKERQVALKFWECAHIAINRLKTEAIRKRIEYDISAQVPVTYTDKNGHDKTKEGTIYYASAKHAMEYLTGFYAPTDNLAQRACKRRLGGVASCQYGTLEKAVKAGINPQDYVTVYKTMKVYFSQDSTKGLYNDKSRPYMKGAVEKLMHPTFKNILEENTHNNVGTDWTRKLNRLRQGRKEMVMKSLHEAAVTPIEQDLLECVQAIQNENDVPETLEAKGDIQMVTKSLHEAAGTAIEEDLLEHAQAIQNENDVPETLEANGDIQKLVKSLHEATVTAIEEDLLGYAHVIQNKNEVRKTLEAKGNNQEGLNIEQDNANESLQKPIQSNKDTQPAYDMVRIQSMSRDNDGGENHVNTHHVIPIKPTQSIAHQPANKAVPPCPNPSKGCIVVSCCLLWIFTVSIGSALYVTK